MSTDPVTLMLVHLGCLPLREAMAAGRWRMEGDPSLVRRLSVWVGLSRYARVQPAAGNGRERRRARSA